MQVDSVVNKTSGRKPVLASETPRTEELSLLAGRYQIKQLHSKGGMGAVYHGVDTELNRPVALKCLLDTESSASRDLAFKEARTLAALSHPNILRIYDVQVNGAKVWIVSEWIEGKSLAQLPLPLPTTTVIAVMIQVFAGLAKSHQAGVFHRDLKPSNIMISKEGRVCLIDFGVAFAPGVSSGETLAGSLRYTDPRLLEGNPPDQISDLFSTALLMTELLTGYQVLPDLAPLPLYQYICSEFDNTIERLCDGLYPPLVSIIKTYCRRHNKSQNSLAAQTARDLLLTELQKITSLTSEIYLNKFVNAAHFQDYEVEQKLMNIAREQLNDSHLSPKDKSLWIAFASNRSDSNSQTALAKTPVDVLTPRSKIKMLVISTVFLLSVGGLVGLLLEDDIRTLFKDYFAAGIEPNLERSNIMPRSPTPIVNETKPELPTEDQKVNLDKISLSKPKANPKNVAPAVDVNIKLVANVWAEVFIDGEFIGKLPRALPFVIKSGHHQLEVKNPYMLTYSKRILVPDSAASQQYYVELQPKTALKIFRLEKPGRLFIGGQDYGLVHDTVQLTIALGNHDVRIERPQQSPLSKQILISPDTPEQIILEGKE